MIAVIFDVDGVIVDVRDSYHLAIKKTSEHFYGKEIPLNYIKKIKFSKGINNDWDVTDEVLRSLGVEVDYKDIVKKFTEFYEELKYNEKQVLSKGFFLELKEKGIPLGIVTGRPKEDLNFVLERFDLKEVFDFTVDEDDILDKSLRKPHPYPLHLCMEAMGAQRGIYIGDNKADHDMVIFYRKMYGKPVEFIHFKRIIKQETGAKHVAEDERELKEKIFSLLKELQKL